MIQLTPMFSERLKTTRAVEMAGKINELVDGKAAQEEAKYQPALHG
jgi:hypothetical protein